MAVRVADGAYRDWLAELRGEAEKFYSNFEVDPDHWRSDYTAGMKPRDALMRVMDAIFEPTDEQLAAFRKRRMQ